MKRSLATFAALTLIGALVPVVAFASCARADTQITLSGFDADVAGEQIYVAVEGDDPKESFTVQRLGLSCQDELDVQVDYELVSGSTGPPRVSVDGGNSGTLTLEAPPRSGGGSGNKETRTFSVQSNAGATDVEHATIRLGEVGKAGLDQVGLGFPRQAPVFVVDDDATDVPFSFGMSSYARQESFTLGVPVFRSGPATGTESIDFGVSGSGAAPAAADDFEVLTQGPLVYQEGERVQVIEIEMLEDTENEPDEELTISLEDQDGTVGQSIVTIENLSVGGGELKPTGRLHHPKHNYKYPQNYPWLHEIHIFTKSADPDELVVDRARMSLLKKMKGGGCRWWDGSGFVKQGCNDKRWFSKRIKNPSVDYFKYKIKKTLPRSTGKKTHVKNYKIWARWYDNREHASEFRKGKNANVFEVIKPTRACKKNPYNFRKCKPVKP
ncbi:MAG: Calx-beta domain-containing protein [Actinomycetota bacterium]